MIKYDNCYPRMDGQTRCFLSAKSNQYMSNTSISKSGGCDDGCNQYEDILNSLIHFPSFWQEPSEESRYLPQNYLHT